MKKNKSFIKYNTIKWYIISVLYFGMLEISLAQNPNIQAKKNLDETDEKINKISTLYINFTYEYKNKKGDLLNSEIGEIYLTNNKYRLSLMEKTYIGDKEKIYTISSKDKEITISNIDNIKNIIFPIQIVLNYIQKSNINNYFKYRKNRVKKLFLLKLIPKKKCSIKELSLVLDSKTRELKEIHKIGEDGQIMSILINRYIPEVMISKPLLEFGKEYYPDYIITHID